MFDDDGGEEGAVGTAVSGPGGQRETAEVDEQLGDVECWFKALGNVAEEAAEHGPAAGA